MHYLKTETRKNSEKNYTNVSLDGRCSNFLNNALKNLKFWVSSIFMLVYQTPKMSSKSETWSPNPIRFGMERPTYYKSK